MIQQQHTMSENEQDLGSFMLIVSKVIPCGHPLPALASHAGLPIASALQPCDINTCIYIYSCIYHYIYIYLIWYKLFSDLETLPSGWKLMTEKLPKKCQNDEGNTRP